MRISIIYSGLLIARLEQALGNLLTPAPLDAVHRYNTLRPIFLPAGQNRGPRADLCPLSHPRRGKGRGVTGHCLRQRSQPRARALGAAARLLEEVSGNSFRKPVIKHR